MQCGSILPEIGAPNNSNNSPLFQIDEKYMKTGVKAMLNVALEYLTNHCLTR